MAGLMIFRWSDVRNGQEEMLRADEVELDTTHRWEECVPLSHPFLRLKI